VLIVGRTRDYYDLGASFGVDKLVVYDRQNKLVVGEKVDLPVPHREEYWKLRKGKRYDYLVDKFVVGFCGRFHPCVMVRVLDDHRRVVSSDCFYDPWTLRKFLESEGLKLSGPSYYWHDGFRVSSEKETKDWFALDTSSLSHLFRKYNTPVLRVAAAEMWSSTKGTGAVLELSPVLLHCQFYKVADPASAFQQVYGYISGVLGTPSRPTVEVSDREMAKKRGHDGKYSFRKPPGEKKRGKKKR